MYYLKGIVGINIEILEILLSQIMCQVKRGVGINGVKTNFHLVSW